MDWVHVCSYFYCEEISELACKMDGMFFLFLNERQADLGFGEVLTAW